MLAEMPSRRCPRRAVVHDDGVQNTSRMPAVAVVDALPDFLPDIRHSRLRPSPAIDAPPDATRQRRHDAPERHIGHASDVSLRLRRRRCRHAAAIFRHSPVFDAAAITPADIFHVLASDAFD